MTVPDKLFQHITRVEDFAFDGRVAKVFDDMVSRSVPFYNEIQRLQADLIMDFLPEESGVVCDLGCSTGTTLEHLTRHPRCPNKALFMGFDNSEPMLDKARSKLSVPIASGQVELRLGDLSCLNALPECHVVILNWALQFVRPMDREGLLKTIFQALKPGGILLLSEKILAQDPLLNRLYIDHYLRFKKSQSGYSDEENQRKREALENVLIPYRLDENMALLERAGFTHNDTYFQWFNFVCMIALR
ncbi:MAG: carboxy-S-adenosyl-L-methionine synthase CmoA [Methylovulum sp.]|uniref:carboxy-S-adenosyl-L-methionine synthase CmoA n=1 Tax=Methylovulum sp. TaxID=1916980 RepID=UPI002637FA78|nr:carboxy-S-adenosyl-L-methionine synthase CmoA [Methylovulum sp.]MDD2723374.1 carboxy-S-adenosyl-L-methionine synthase CmoA [Methylovulum sp.]MDD5124259.1 carboxy-S-adenosyl-L-methionine synthase CmoA [Methylovulum sp.]